MLYNYMTFIPYTGSRLHKITAGICKIFENVGIDETLHFPQMRGEEPESMLTKLRLRLRTGASHIRIHAIYYVLSISDINIRFWLFPKLCGMWATPCLNPWQLHHLWKRVSTIRYVTAPFWWDVLLVLLAFEHLGLIFGRGDYHNHHEGSFLLLSRDEVYILLLLLLELYY
jgi:hypothetical protein